MKDKHAKTLHINEEKMFCYTLTYLHTSIGMKCLNLVLLP